MNPRVSRSSALASKATGFPIAKIAARLAVGYTLDEIINDITGATPACFEPTIDYVVTKIPRFAFEKFRGSPAVLTTSMKSVGEAMAIGRCFEESFQKALRSLETGHAGWGCDRPDPETESPDLEPSLRTPSPDRIFRVRDAMVAGRSDEDIHRISAIDPWFLAKLRGILAVEQPAPGDGTLERLDGEAFLELKQFGFSDRQIAWATGSDELVVRRRRQALGVRVLFKTVDTCAAEFASTTPYHYATYERALERIGADGSITALAPADEVQAGKPPQGDDPGGRTQPHRPGDRIRLLLLPCLLRPSGGGLRHGDGEQQSGNRLHRLRHQRPALLRTPHPRGRAQCDRGRASLTV